MTTLPNKSTQVRRAYYGSGTPVSPVYYDDVNDNFPNTDVLDTVLLYGNQYNITGYRWDENLSYQIPVSNSNDPIGDALRTSAIGYWKFDNLSGTRPDSTSHGINLVQAADGTPPSNAPVISAVGKIDRAVKIFDNTVSVNMLTADPVNIPISDVMTFWGWVRVPQLTGEGQVMATFDFDTASFFIIDTWYIVRREDGTMYFSAQNSNLDPGLADVIPDTWYFGITEFDFINGTVKLSVNNTNPVSIAVSADDIKLFPAQSPFAKVNVGYPNYVSDTDYILMDEWGGINRIMTQPERDYLYNSGNGRTLYP